MRGILIMMFSLEGDWDKGYLCRIYCFKYEIWFFCVNEKNKDRVSREKVTVLHRKLESIGTQKEIR